MNKQKAVWIASYPKSGNTWVHSVVRVAGKKYGFPQVDMDVYNMLRSGASPVECPAVNGQVVEQPCSVLKTHAAYKNGVDLHAFPDLQVESGAFVHIYRNPLDVLLSYLNFTRIEFKPQANNEAYKNHLFVTMLGFDQAFDFEQWVEMGLDSIPQQNLDHALDYFSDHGLSIGTLSGMSGGWIEHTQSWIDAAEDLPGFSIRYEDCLSNPSEFDKLCSIFVFTKSDVVAALDFVNSRAQSMSASGSPEQAVFYNKMSAYYFRDYFSSDAISRFLTRHEETLINFGYSELLKRD